MVFLIALVLSNPMSTTSDVLFAQYQIVPATATLVMALRICKRSKAEPLVINSSTSARTFVFAGES